MKTEISAGTDASVMVRTGDIETILPVVGTDGPIAVGLLHDQIIRQRGIIDGLPKCWQTVDVFLSIDYPIVPGMTLISIAEERDVEIIVGEVGSDYVNVAEQTDSDGGGFWKTISVDDCCDSPATAARLRKFRDRKQHGK